MIHKIKNWLTLFLEAALFGGGVIFGMWFVAFIIDNLTK